MTLYVPEVGIVTLYAIQSPASIQPTFKLPPVGSCVVSVCTPDIDIQLSACMVVENEGTFVATRIDVVLSFHPAPTRHELSAVTTSDAPLKLSFSYRVTL